VDSWRSLVDSWRSLVDSRSPPNYQFWPFSFLPWQALELKCVTRARDRVDSASTPDGSPRDPGGSPRRA